MAISKKPRIIAVEEHYWDPEVAAHFDGADTTKAPGIRERLEDLGALRLKEMDEAGVDLPGISHGPPPTQKIDPPTAVRLARRAHHPPPQAAPRHPPLLAGLSP